MHDRLKIGLLVLFVAALSLLPEACTQRVDRKQSRRLSEVDAKAPYLKAYTREGTLYVLTRWSADSTTVHGDGTLYDLNRKILSTTHYDIPVANVSLFETNSLSLSSATIGMVIVAVGHAALLAYCAANPKACFGSCPTFYVNDGSKEALMAEGFSSSIVPSEEASDVDALYFAHPVGRELSVTMKNEALETHVIRSVEVLDVPRAEGERVFKTDDDRFFAAPKLYEPIQCYGEAGSAMYEVRKLDGVELHSESDSTDLARKETLDLTFDPGREPGEFGLVLGVRQAFVSTFMFYQGLSYLGTHAGDYLSLLNRRDPTITAQSEQMKSLLGGIEVWGETSPDRWRMCGEVKEMGPIATDLHLVPLTGMKLPHHLRLRMSKGSWRIDWVALARLSREVQPIVLEPTSRVHTEEHVLPTENLSGIQREGSQTDCTLVTLPGDVYTYHFTLPDVPHHSELFLRSKGYYLEWMREDWLREENAAEAALMLLDPENALKRNARKFKDLEPEMESSFWKSKISRQIQ